MDAALITAIATTAATIAGALSWWGRARYEEAQARKASEPLPHGTSERPETTEAIEALRVDVAALRAEAAELRERETTALESIAETLRRTEELLVRVVREHEDREREHADLRQRQERQGEALAVIRGR